MCKPCFTPKLHHCRSSCRKFVMLHAFVQARYQKERAANRRNEILLDQLCTEIEVKAVAVQNQQVQHVAFVPTARPAALPSNVVILALSGIAECLQVCSSRYWHSGTVMIQ